MLATSEVVGLVAGEIKAQRAASVASGRPPAAAVVDPVMVSTSGHYLLEPDAVKTMREQLIPLATIITPNLHEAKLLLEDSGYAGQDLSKML